VNNSLISLIFVLLPIVVNAQSFSEQLDKKNKQDQNIEMEKNKSYRIFYNDTKIYKCISNKREVYSFFYEKKSELPDSYYKFVNEKYKNVHEDYTPKKLPNSGFIMHSQSILHNYLIEESRFTDFQKQEIEYFYHEIFPLLLRRDKKVQKEILNKKEKMDQLKRSYFFENKLLNFNDGDPLMVEASLKDNMITSTISNTGDLFQLEISKGEIYMKDRYNEISLIANECKLFKDN
jgi:hypothetical protein